MELNQGIRPAIGNCESSPDPSPIVERISKQKGLMIKGVILRVNEIHNVQNIPYN